MAAFACNEGRERSRNSLQGQARRASHHGRQDTTGRRFVLQNAEIHRPALCECRPSLGSRAAAAGEDPRRHSARVVHWSADEGGVFVAGQRDRGALSRLAFPTPPAPTKLVPCWDAALFLLGQTPPLRVKIHAARVFKSSQSPLTIAVLPSPDSAIEAPCRAFPAAPAPTSFGPLRELR
jgi:hypothetical protein